MAEIEIQAISLSEPFEVKPPEGATGAPLERVKIQVEARNRSSDTTYHAVSEARQIRFDPATRTLFVSTSDPPPDEADLHHLFAPAQTPILPDETATIGVTVPRVIRMLRVGEGPGLGGIAFDEVDMSSVQNVVCELSYADTPFRRDPEQTPKEMSRQLRERAETARVELPVKLGQRAERKSAE
jgi:hypothetical protein